jgi:hypothetical protein
MTRPFRPPNAAEIPVVREVGLTTGISAWDAAIHQRAIDPVRACALGNAAVCMQSLIEVEGITPESVAEQVVLVAKEFESYLGGSR